MQDIRTDLDHIPYKPYATYFPSTESSQVSIPCHLPKIKKSLSKAVCSTDLARSIPTSFYCTSPQLSQVSSNNSIQRQDLLQDMITGCNDIKESLPHIWTNLRKSVKKNIQSFKSLKGAARISKINGLKYNDEYLVGKSKIQKFLKDRDNPLHDNNIQFIQALLKPAESSYSESNLCITHLDFQDHIKLHLLQNNRRMFGRKMLDELNIESPRSKLVGNPKIKDIHIHGKNSDLLEDIYAYQKEAANPLRSNKTKETVSPIKTQKNFYKDDNFLGKVHRMDPLNKFIFLEMRKFMPKNISDLNRKKRIQTEARMMAIKASEETQRKARIRLGMAKKKEGRVRSTDSSMDDITYRIRIEKLVGRM